MDEREESVVFYAGDTATERIGLKLHIVGWLRKLVLWRRGLGSQRRCSKTSWWNIR